MSEQPTDAATNTDAISSGKRLRNKPARRPGGYGGFTTTLFGLPFIGAGVAIMLIAADVIKVDPDSIHAPRWVLGLVGFIFFAPGLFISLAGLKGGLARRRAQQRLAQNPKAYWIADYPWNEQGDRERPVRKIIQHCVVGVFLIAFLAPFNYFVFYKGDAPIFAKIIVGFFDLIPFFVLGSVIYKILQYLKYGVSSIAYQQFPYFLGDTCEIVFDPGRGIGNYNNITFTLHCLREVTVTTGSGKNRSSTTYVYELWSDEFKVEEAGHHAGGESIPLTFLLPTDRALTTRITDNPRPVYWELEVHADTPGVDFKAEYLVPVYHRERFADAD